MNISELSEILKSNQHETDTYDFKERWENTNSELLKDILSFANTAHHKDCYLIYGIDDNKHVVGITNEDKNKKNQQMITDFLTHVHFANDSIPDVIFNTLPVDGKIVNILTIKDSDQVPFYLADDFKGKGKGRPISRGTIFFRDKDSDFGFQSVPPYKTMEKLWQKHFHLDLKPKDRFPYLLDDIKNWTWNDGETKEFIYDFNPDYSIEIKSDASSDDRSKFKSFACGLSNPQIFWSSVSLKYKQKEVTDSLTGMSLDGGRGFEIFPQCSPINGVYYFYYFLNSLSQKIGNVVNYQRGNATDKGTIDEYLNSIVQYRDDNQRQLVESKIKSKPIDFSPKAEEVKKLNEHLISVSDKEYVERHNFSSMINEIKLTRYIKAINK